MLEHPSIPASMTSREIVKELIDDAQLLMKRQVELAQLEGKRQLKREIRSAGILGVAAGVGYAALIVLIVAAALAIGDSIGGRDWLGALIVGGALLICAAVALVVGWSARVKQPLRRTRTEVNKELSWLRHHPVTT